MSKMKLIMENFRKQMKSESQWGGFTGGAAPLDSEQRELPEMPYEQQLDLFSLIVNRGDKDPKELLYHPENFQNGLSFPDLTEEDVEDILDKLGLPSLGILLGSKISLEEQRCRTKACPNHTSRLTRIPLRESCLITLRRIHAVSTSR